MNPDLSKLQPYPFEKLRHLLHGVAPPAELSPINLSIGEPRHPAPEFVTSTLAAALDGVSGYPATRGTAELRQSIAGWLTGRFGLRKDSVDPDHHVLPVNGTREALFAFAQAIVDRTRNPLVLMPNPFYQIYEGAALLAGAESGFLNCTAEDGFIPDYDAVPEAAWNRCQLLYICSPGNPSGAVMTGELLQKLILLADRHDFVIASDECYSEIYLDETAPPAGLLQACADMGRYDFRRCVVFHSLSKRSNLPGMRSGFVAGDADILAKFLLYRTYHGCAMPLHHQRASVAAWNDEEHVVENRAVYQRKFQAVKAILDPVMPVSLPDGAFYLWLETPGDDETFARELFARQHITVLPGSYLARDTESGNPGRGRVRVALVAGETECTEAAGRIRTFLEK